MCCMNILVLDMLHQCVIVPDVRGRVGSEGVQKLPGQVGSGRSRRFSNITDWVAMT